MSFINSIFNILRFNKKNWKAVVLCIFAATIFWCFNALNKSYTTTLNFPLTFDYDRERYVPVRPLPEGVKINVTGIGWNLFRRGAGVKVPPLVIPLDHPSEVKKIVGSTLPGLFSNQLGGFQINFIITDTLHLAVEPKGTRTFKLEPDVSEIIFRRGYVRTSDVTISPDSVKLTGPVRLISSLSNPLLIKIPQRNIDDSYNEAVDLKFLNDELIERSPSTVNIRFQVDQLVEVTDSVGLRVINSPKQAWQVIERELLACTVAVPERSLDTFSRDSVKAIIDLKNIRKGVNKVMPSLSGLPPYSKVIRLDSVAIKF